MGGQLQIMEVKIYLHFETEEEAFPEATFPTLINPSSLLSYEDLIKVKEILNN